jgi:prevent-host-death family protein
MISIGAYEAKTKLAHLLDEVEAGRTVTITRHGQPVARLVPADGRSDMADVIADVRAARRGVRRGRTSISEMKAAGRR